MLSQDQFEAALKKDRSHLFAPNPVVQAQNELFVKQVYTAAPPINGKSKREEIWEQKKKRREEKSAFPADLIGGPPPPPPNEQFSQEPQYIPRQIETPPAFSKPAVLPQAPPPPSYQPPPQFEQRMPQEFEEPKMPSYAPPQPQANIKRPMYMPDEGIQQNFKPQMAPMQFQTPPREIMEPSPVNLEPDNSEFEKKRRYADELKAQLAFKEQKAKEEKMARINKERQELQVFESNNPYGKGGCGAPLRDKYGQIITQRKPILTNPTAAPVQQTYMPSIPQTMQNAYPPQYAPNALLPRYPSRPPMPQSPIQQTFESEYQPSSYQPQYNINPIPPPGPPPDYYQRPQYEPPPMRPPIDFAQPPPNNYPNMPIERPRGLPPTQQEPEQKENFVPDYVTRIYDADKELDKKRKAIEMQRALAEQVEIKKRLKDEEKKKRDLEEKLEEERIMRERKEMEEQFKKEQEDKKKKLDDVRAANLALAEAKLAQPKNAKGRRNRQSEVPPVDENKPTIPEPAPLSRDRKRRVKNDLFGDAPADNKNDLFSKPIEVNLQTDQNNPQQIEYKLIPGPKVIEKETEFEVKEVGFNRKEVPKDVVDKISQTKIINEISEKLKENINSQLLEMKQQMEQQQKHLVGELGNLKNEAKEALDQKALAQNELNQLKQELEGRKKVEEAYDKQLMNALSKDYKPTSRPSSKSRALMSRGEGRKELQNYEKLFFNNIEMATPKIPSNAPPVQMPPSIPKYPLKMYDKAGDTLSASSTINQAEGSLKADSKLINLGCVDPNKSLYMPNDTRSIGLKSTMKKVDNNSYVLQNTKKAVDTLDFLDKIAGLPRKSSAERKMREEIGQTPKAAENTISSTDSVRGDQAKLNKYLKVTNEENATFGKNQPKDTIGTLALNSAKIHEINKLNNERLEELENLSKNKANLATSTGDELDKLDDLLLDIMRSEKNGAESSLKNTEPKKIPLNSPKKLDSIHEADIEDSLKGGMKGSLKGTSQMQGLNTADLQLPTLKDSM